MNMKLRHARQTLTSAEGDHSGPYDSLVRLFAKSAKLATPAFALLALAGAFAAHYWFAAWTGVALDALAATAVAMRFSLGWAYLRRPIREVAGRWRFYSSPQRLFPAWSGRRCFSPCCNRASRGRGASPSSLSMLVAGMTAMVASAISGRGRRRPAADHGRGDLRHSGRRARNGRALRCCARHFPLLVILANRPASSALAGLSFQAEKDALIAELEQAKLNSDEARRRAEGANLAKSRFLATMSHELRTPLNAILGFSEVMKAELFGAHAVPAYKEYSNDIHSSGQHLLMLINEILDLSRVEAGRYELKEEAVSLPGVVEECRHLWRCARRTADHRDRMVDDHLPRIWADERAVRQVTLNLLSNAIKFTPQGGEITIKVGWTPAGGQYLSIRDTGPASPKTKSRSCCPLSAGLDGAKERRRRQRARSADREGLVELHGGEFKLESKVREGTEVIVIFPPERVMNALPQIDPDAPPGRSRQKAAERGRRRGGRAAA